VQWDGQQASATRRLWSRESCRAAVNGRLINVHRFTGEYSDPEYPIFDVVVDGSIEAVLYVSQKHSEALRSEATLAGGFRCCIPVDS